MPLVKQKHGGAIVNAAKGETANRNGRPRKGISLVNHELKEKGYEPATKADIQENYMAMIQLSEPELKPLMTDMTKPILVRIIAKNLLDKKGFDIIERMIDRAHGKAEEKKDSLHRVEKVTAEEAKILRALLK